MSELLEVRGLAELQQLLDTLPLKLERNVVRGALRAGAKVFKEEALRRVPVKTGKLRKSLRVSVRTRRGVPVAFVKAGNKEAFYGHFVEFGTRGHAIKAKAGKALFLKGLFADKVQHPGALAQPFMRPAFDAGARPAIGAFAAYVRKRLTKAGLELPSE